MLCAFMAFVHFAAVPEESELKDPFRLERGSMMARWFKKDTFLLTKDALFSYGRPILDQKSCCNCHFSNFQKSTFFIQ